MKAGSEGSGVYTDADKVIHRIGRGNRSTSDSNPVRITPMSGLTPKVPVRTLAAFFLDPPIRCFKGSFGSGRSLQA